MTHLNINLKSYLNAYHIYYIVSLSTLHTGVTHNRRNKSNNKFHLLFVKWENHSGLSWTRRGRG